MFATHLVEIDMCLCKQLLKNVIDINIWSFNNVQKYFTQVTMRIFFGGDFKISLSRNNKNLLDLKIFLSINNNNNFSDLKKMFIWNLINNFIDIKLF